MPDNTILLADGRTLAYALYGPADGQRCLYFHGTPGSRLELLLFDYYSKDISRLLHHYNLCIIAVDRPGMGLSSFNPKGTFSSFASDSFELLKYLGVQKCKLLCWSGGGPFALAMAYSYPETITQVYIITGFTLSFGNPDVYKPMHGNKLYFGAAKYVPWLARWVLARAAKSQAGKPIPQWLSKLPDADHRLMLNREVNKHLARISLMEACRSGSRGVVYEAALYFNDAGYKLCAIQQPVHFWHGDLDNTVLLLHAKAVDQQVPNSIMHYIEGEGHLSLIVNRIEEILAVVSETPVS